MQYVHNHNMNGWSQVITGVEFNCSAAMQGTHHVIYISFNKCPLPSEWRTS